MDFWDVRIFFEIKSNFSISNKTNKCNTTSMSNFILPKDLFSTMTMKKIQIWGNKPYPHFPFCSVFNNIINTHTEIWVKHEHNAHVCVSHCSDTLYCLIKKYYLSRMLLLTMHVYKEISVNHKITITCNYKILKKQ